MRQLGDGIGRSVTAMSGSFEFLEHTADFRILARADSFEELCVMLARGMMQWMFGDLPQPQAAEWEESWKSSGADLEDITVEWLSSILTYCSLHYCAAVTFSRPRLVESTLQAAIGFLKAQAIDDIKAVTYHDLTVRQEDGRWQATVTFDI